MVTTPTLRFYQLHNAYAYNSDSLVLLDFAMPYFYHKPPHTTPHAKDTPPHISPRIRPKPLAVLDMGAGCGILGVSCACHFHARVVAIEQNAIMAHLASINARTNLAYTHALQLAQSTALESSPHNIALLHQAEARRDSHATHTGACAVLCADFLDSATPQAALTALATLDSKAPKSSAIESSAIESAVLRNPQDSKAIESSLHDTALESALKSSSQSPHITHPAQAKHAKQAQCSTHPAQARRRFDILIANPPFYHDGALRSHNPFLRQARYEDSLPLSAWIHQSKKLLTPRGALIFCFQASDVARVLETLSSNGFACERLRFVHPLVDKPAKLALFYARLDSKAKPQILPPLFTHNSPAQSDFSPEVASIYKRFATHSIKVNPSDVLLLAHHSPQKARISKLLLTRKPTT